jgi:hypothetical protein
MRHGPSKSKSHCDWQSVSQSVLVSSPIWAHGQIFMTLWQFRSCFVGRPLWRENGSVFCICCWPLPAQSFLGPSPLGLATIFYCLRFETSLFVTSYDSQGHGGGIRSRLHTGRIQNNAFNISSLPGNVFTELLLSIDKEIHRQTHRLSFNTTRTAQKMTRSTILLLSRVFIAARTYLPGRCLATIYRQTDGRDLWSTPLRLAQLPWYAYQVS